MKLIILDLGGVINHDSDDDIKTPPEWEPIPGSVEAIARLTHAGWRAVVASNQPGIARGLFDIEILNRIHDRMHRMVHEAGGTIDAVFFCADEDDDSPCRKPNPGMLIEIGRRLRVHLRGVPVIGDSMHDIEAARAVDAQPFLVLTGRGRRTLDSEGSLEGVPVFPDLGAVVDYLLSLPDSSA